MHRHLGEFRIAVIGLAVGEGEFGGLDQVMDIGGRIMTHRVKVKTFQQPQLLKKDRTLRPGLAFVHGDAAIVGADRLLDIAS